MSINQISTLNTFGQLITTVSALVAVANNFTDGPQSQTGSTWTFTNANVGVNVIGTILSTIANVGILNVSEANVTNETVGRSNISTANVTVANIGGATIIGIISTDHLSANANITGLLQVSDRANIFSANIQTANIGTVAITSLTVAELTVPVLNASFANVTTLSVTGTSQHNALIATLVTVANANVSILNASTANITGETVGTSNISVGNITTLTVGTLNLSVANITNQTVETLNVTFANITTETVGTANISLANITNTFIATLNASSANITSGIISVSGDPTSNLNVATKHYVDTGAGANLVSKISFNAKGDIILGTGANTYAALSTGTNGQVVIVDTTQATGARYSDRASQTFRGLVMGTSLADKSANGTQLVVYKLDEVVMDDGEVVANWTVPSTIDITSNGAAGFLDTGVVVANTWYEVYAIRKSSDGTKNFIIHRALDRKPDQNTMNPTFWPTVAGAGLGLGANSTVALANSRLAQSFTPNVAGPLTSIEIRAFKTGATANGNVWITLEANSAGNPSGTTLATSRKMDLARLGVTTAANLRFIFDTTANVALSNSYFWIFNSDYPASATLFANLVYSLANTDIAANGVNAGVPKGNSGSSWTDLRPGIGTFMYKTYVEANGAAITMPAGYDQSCLISYAATDANTQLKEYHQFERTIQTYYNSQWSAGVVWQIQNPEVIDLLTVVPPIPCMVSLFANIGGAIQSIGYGRFHALDIVSAIAETRPGITFGVVSGGTTVAPSLPLWIEHQAILVRIQTSLTKIYPATISF